MATKKKIQKIAFEDIADLTDREIQMILKEVDTKDMSVALVGSTDRLNERIFANLSDRVGAIVKNEMAFLNTNQSEINAAQARILEVVHRFQEKGQISPPCPAKTVRKRKLKPSKQYLAMKRTVNQLAKRPLSQLSLDEINELLVGFAEIARLEGILALEDLVKNPGDEFFAQGVRLAVDGMEPPFIDSILETWMRSLMHEHEVKYMKIIEGVGAIQRGYNPRIVEQHLKVLY